MIRSLVFEPNTTSDSAQQRLIRRNLTPDDLTRAFHQKNMMWIDIIEGNEHEIDWIESLLSLNVIVTEDLKRKDTRPTLIAYPDYLFMTLFEPGSKGYRITNKEIHCIITDTAFITVRPENAKSVDQAYNRVTRSPEVWQQAIAYFLYLTTRHVIDAYYPIVDQISNELNRLEERLLEGHAKERSSSQRTIHQRKQQLITLRQMVAPQREVLSSVVGEKRLSQSAETRDLFRHLYERLLRVYDVIDSQRELSNTVLDTLQSQESQELVQVVNRLTILSMIFLPLTFFTGLLELNFATTENPIILPINGRVLFYFLLVVLLSTVVGMGTWFKRRGWI
jgi:magnesium transporter